VLGDALAHAHIPALRNPATPKIAANREYNLLGETIRAQVSLANTSHTAVINPIRFSTKYWDEETGFCYFGFRHYDPVAGRWLSQDPRGEEGGLNLYGFVGNNPISFVDPLGLHGDISSTERDGTIIYKDGDMESPALPGTRDNEPNYSNLALRGNEGCFVNNSFTDPETGRTVPGVGVFDEIEKEVASNIALNVIGGVAGKGLGAAAEQVGSKLAAKGTGSISKFLCKLGLCKKAAKAVKGVSVIGPRANYRQFAKDINANYLKETDEAWTWAKNEEFLAGIVQRGDDVVFAGKFSPEQLDPNSVLAREINYLIERGYKWTEDFSRLTR